MYTSTVKSLIFGKRQGGNTHVARDSEDMLQVETDSLFSSHVCLIISQLIKDKV